MPADQAAQYDPTAVQPYTAPEPVAVKQPYIPPPQTFDPNNLGAAGAQYRSTGPLALASQFVTGLIQGRSQKSVRDAQNNEQLIQGAHESYNNDAQKYLELMAAGAPPDDLTKAKNAVNVSYANYLEEIEKHVTPPKGQKKSVGQKVKGAMQAPDLLESAPKVLDAMKQSGPPVFAQATLMTYQKKREEAAEQLAAMVAEDNISGKWTPVKNATGPNGEALEVNDRTGETRPIAGSKSFSSKTMEPATKGGVTFGVRDQLGRLYLPSQLGPNGDAPQEAKDIWTTVKAAEQQKRDDEQRKEDERAAAQARTIGAAFERAGASEQFQEQMAQYRADESTYRALDTVARNSQETVAALGYQYKQPGNKAVADNELQNFYTTVVQKGGRKTAAEFALTAKIGSFGMNLQQMAKKAASGELPDELRAALLAGMETVAKEQRKMADQAKPDLPEISDAYKGTSAGKAQSKSAAAKPSSSSTDTGKDFWSQFVVAK